MSNFIFISPNFPTNYWQFCRELKNDGMNVLGIGDQPYDELKPELKDSLNEYYKVGSLENYDEVYRAVAFFAFKYGRIDWLESNNEYWLERDAALRTDFHITSGFQTEDMPRIKYKSKMKEYYQKAGIATARYHMVDDLESCRKFINEVGYPVVVKPDNGVGASDTHKLSSDEELKRFLLYKSTYHPDLTYIMEEFVRAEVNSYDAIIDGSGNPIFEAGNVSPMSIMDIVNNDDNSIYYIIKDLPDDTRAAGRAAVKSFGVKSRFVHFEFFRMTEDQTSMAKLLVYSPSMEQQLSWSMTSNDGTPLRMAFSPDSRKLAAAAVTVSGGQVMTNLYLINLASGDPVSLVNQGGVPQWLGWTSASTILAVYDTRAVLYNAGGGERAVYDFAGTELKDVSVDAAGNVALLLASGQVSQAVTLDKNLNVQFSAAVPAANSIVRAGNLFYLLADNAVECFDASGTQQWSQNLDTSPQALLANSKDLLLFSGNTVQKLEIPAQGS